jgi:hypothetical protein
MIKLARWLLMPLFLANITIAANGWHVMGVGLGEALFWAIIALSAYLAWHSPYRTLGGAALVSSLLLRLLELAVPTTAIEAARHGSLAVLMMTAGARAYGRDPRLLARQLVLYLALCLPVMLLQITGAHPFFMTWDSDSAHDLTVLSIEEIGTFKQIPLYPTLFVTEDDLHYFIAQGRPSGLSYANNVLSVFAAITAGLALALARKSRIGVSGVVVSAVLVLTMSMTALLSAAFLYAAVFLFGESRRRWYVVKVTALTGAFLWMYAWLFPGLFAASFSSAKMMVRLFSRGMWLFDLVGVSFVRRMYDWNGAYLWGIIEPGETYSGIQKLILSPFVGVFAILGLVTLVWYLRAVSTMRRSRDSSWFVYPVTAAMCVLTQFGVPYLGAVSFQCILGFAMFPILQSLWPARSRRGAVSGIAEAAPAVS